MKRLNKTLMFVAAAAFLSYGLNACRGPEKDHEHPTGEHAEADSDHPEHPAGEHPEHPKGDHPEHPKGD